MTRIVTIYGFYKENWSY